MGVQVTRAEVAALAKAGRLAFDDAALDGMAHKLADVLNYVSILQGNLAIPQAQADTRALVVRPDVVRPADSDTIRAGAPRVEERYFVVPAVLNV